MDARYNLIIDDGKSLSRVQIKYANGTSTNTVGAVTVNLAYETRGRSRVYTYQKSEVEALIVYIPRIDKLCWFPSQTFVGKKELSIRIELPRNGQKRGIFYASDYYW